MRTKAIASIMVLMFLGSMLTLAFNIEAVKASGTIYIRLDGSIDPSTAPIQRDGDLYTFKDNIYDEIVVERDNIVVDGAGYILQGAGSGNGIKLSAVSNVTIMNMNTKGFKEGILLMYSSNSTISENNITTNNDDGIDLHHSSNNIISGNNITANYYAGIFLYESSNNTISGNNITAHNYFGIRLTYSSDNNTISGNNIANNYIGISLYYSSDNNTISGNNIANNDGGIGLSYSSNNAISGNNIANNFGGGISLYYSYSSAISGNNITNNAVGIGLFASGSNIISGNNITANNADGIKLHHSSNNIISGNDITANIGYGIWLNLSSSIYAARNAIFHNNFVNNGVQAYTYKSFNVWDYVLSLIPIFLSYPYPSGGNYWSNYIDQDLFSGPFQNITGPDGIWDHPYVLDANNTDNYPLVRPWTPGPTERIQELIESIETWNLARGIENGLTRKLDASLYLLSKGNENGAIHKLMDFIDQVEALRGKKLTNDQASYVIFEAQRIIIIIEG